MLKLGTAASAEALLRADEWDAKLITLVRGLMEGLALQGASTEMRVFGPEKMAHPLEFKNPEPVQALRLALPHPVVQAVETFITNALSLPHWSGINVTVRGDLDAALKLGVSEGLNLDQSADLVRDALDGSSRRRAEGIVRTETTGALNAGHDAARRHLAALDIIRGVEWLAIVDGSTRQSHLQAHGQEIAVGGEFVVGGHRCRHPGDQNLPVGERVACRCAAVSIVKED